MKHGKRKADPEEPEADSAPAPAGPSEREFLARLVAAIPAGRFPSPELSVLKLRQAWPEIQAAAAAAREHLTS